jgi:drug/metabolite transporter (DMT)-like permease
VNPPHPHAGASRAKVALALLSTYVLWGSTYYAIVLALPAYPAFLLTAVRMAIAGAIMYAVCAGVARPRPRARNGRASRCWRCS